MTAVVGAIASNPAAVSGILSTISGLFQGSSYDATHTQILAWAQTIANNPAEAATLNPATPAGTAWLQLRCWAGDQTVYAAWRAAGNLGAVCGCEVDHGCRADAQTAVAQLQPMVTAAGGGAVGPLSNSTTTGTSGAVLAVTTNGVTTVSGAGNTAATLSGAGVISTSELLVLAGLGLIAFLLFKR